jgi:uncharacterized membrane protein YfcA
MYFGIYLVIGACSGLLAGLLGLGGGIIVVPALAAAFTHFALFPTNYVMQMAIGTSLTTIFFTFLSSLRAHMQRNSVRWDLVRLFLPGLITGVMIGASIVNYVPSTWLSIFFSLFLLFMAMRLFLNTQPIVAQKILPIPLVIMVTVGIGMLSSLLGVGGGIVLIPFLIKLQIDMRQATGTAVACGVFIAASASICFMLGGHNLALHLPWSTGFIYWPAFLGVAVASVLFAPIGTAIAYKLDPILLKRLLAIFLLIVAVDMLLPLKAH